MRFTFNADTTTMRSSINTYHYMNHSEQPLDFIMNLNLMWHINYKYETENMVALAGIYHEGMLSSFLKVMPGISSRANS